MGLTFGAEGYQIPDFIFFRRSLWLKDKRDLVAQVPIDVQVHWQGILFQNCQQQRHMTEKFWLTA